MCFIVHTFHASFAFNMSYHLLFQDTFSHFLFATDQEDFSRKIFSTQLHIFYFCGTCMTWTFNRFNLCIIFGALVSTSEKASFFHEAIEFLWCHLSAEKELKRSFRKQESGSASESFGSPERKALELLEKQTNKIKIISCLTDLLTKDGTKVF